MAHNKTLTELKWFKWALWGPIGTAAVVATVIGIADFTSEDLRVCFTSSCVNEAISRHKFPLAIASLAFPLVALVASHHRSVQTAAQIARTDQQMSKTDRQIAATEAKNAFENKFKHLEYFSSFLEPRLAENRLEIGNKNSLYDRVFPVNNSFEFRPYVERGTKELKTITHLGDEKYYEFFEVYRVLLMKFCESYALNNIEYATNCMIDIVRMLGVEKFYGVDVSKIKYCREVFVDLYSLCVLYEALSNIYNEIILFCVRPEDIKKHSKIPYTSSSYKVHGDEVFGQCLKTPRDSDIRGEELNHIYSSLRSAFFKRMSDLRSAQEI